MRVLALPLVAALVLSACKSLPVDYPRDESRALQDTGDTRLGRAVAPLLDAHPDLSGVHPLVRGTDAFVARLVLAAGAERSLEAGVALYEVKPSARRPCVSAGRKGE